MLVFGGVCLTNKPEKNEGLLLSNRQIGNHLGPQDSQKNYSPEALNGSFVEPKNEPSLF